MEYFMEELYFVSCFIQMHLYNLFIKDFMKEHISYLVSFKYIYMIYFMK